MHGYQNISSQRKYAKKENAWDAIVIRGNLPLKLFAQIWTLITTLVS